VGIPDLVWPDVLDILLVDAPRVARDRAGRPRKVGFDLRGRMLPDGTFPQGLDIVQRVIQDAVAEHAHGLQSSGSSVSFLSPPAGPA